ncbi:hypothetical protein RFI_33457, partial [Reticulomyxa filosa]
NNNNNNINININNNNNNNAINLGTNHSVNNREHLNGNDIQMMGQPISSFYQNNISLQFCEDGISPQLPIVKHELKDKPNPKRSVDIKNVAKTLHLLHFLKRKKTFKNFFFFFKQKKKEHNKKKYDRIQESSEDWGVYFEEFNKIYAENNQRLPSIRAIMKQFKIGFPKAKDILTKWAKEFLGKS